MTFVVSVSLRKHSGSQAAVRTVQLSKVNISKLRAKRWWVCSLLHFRNTDRTSQDFTAPTNERKPPMPGDSEDQIWQMGSVC